MIQRQHENAANEDVLIELFASTHFDSSATIVYEKVPGEGKPDYVVSVNGEPIVIEVKRIVEASRAKEGARWSKNIDRLKSELEKMSVRSQLRQGYMVRTPFIFPEAPSASSFEAAAKEILTAAIDNKAEVSIFGSTCELHTVRGVAPGIYFSAMGVGWVNFGEAAVNDLTRLLQSANRQLGVQVTSIPPSKKIALLVNVEGTAVSIRDIISKLVQDLSEVQSWGNIDEVFFLTPYRERVELHQIFNRVFLERLVSGRIDVTNQMDIELLGRWIIPLRLSNTRATNENILSLLKNLPHGRPIHDFIPDDHDRMEVVELGKWLVENERLDEAKWLIERFITDPNPPGSGLALEQNELHLKIKRGEDPTQITTVLGHLAWIVQLLALRESTVPDAWRYTRILLEHNNLYVKQQALIPLIEIAHRRHALKQLSADVYSDFRATTFSVLQNYSAFHGIAEWLVKVFYYFRDLTTEETLKVLDLLKDEEDSGALFFYFGVFRELHFKEVPFDPNPVRKRLLDQLNSQQEPGIRIRKEIAYHLFHLSKEHPQEVLNIKKYVDLIIEQAQMMEVTVFIDGIIEHVARTAPEIAVEWTENLVRSVEKRWNALSPKPKGAYFLDIEKSIRITAQISPHRLPGLIDVLKRLQDHGLFVLTLSKENIREVLELIPDYKIRLEVESKL